MGIINLFYQLRGIDSDAMDGPHAYRQRSNSIGRTLPMALKKDSGQIYSGQTFS